MPEHTTAFPPEVADQVEEVMEHVNAQHPDTVLLLARHVGSEPAASDAEMVGADPGGIDLDLVVDGSSRRVRLALAAPAASGEDLQAHVFMALQEARAAVGDDVPLTSLERELAGTAAVPHHPASVLSTRLVAPSMLEVRVGGLQHFTPLGPDTFVLVMVAGDGSEIGDDYTIGDFQAQGDDGPVRAAYYTVREWDATTGVLTLWVVLHDDGDGVATWFRGAQAGARLVLWGPREAYEPPADTDSVLLVADETGLAAVAAIVEQLPPGSRAVALLEAASDVDVPPMPSHPALDVRWTFRDGVAPGADDRLVDAAGGVRLDDGGRWAVFGAGESRQMTRLRRSVRHQRGLPAHRVSVTGYWRRTAH